MLTTMLLLAGATELAAALCVQPSVARPLSRPVPLRQPSVSTPPRAAPVRLAEDGKSNPLFFLDVRACPRRNFPSAPRPRQALTSLSLFCSQIGTKGGIVFYSFVGIGAPFIAYNYMLETLEYDIVTAGNVILVAYVGLATVLWTARCATRRDARTRVFGRCDGHPLTSCARVVCVPSARQLRLPRCEQGHDVRPAAARLRERGDPEALRGALDGGGRRAHGRDLSGRTGQAAGEEEVSGE